MPTSRMIMEMLMLHRSLLMPLITGLILAACQPFGPGRQAVLRGGAVPAGPSEQANQIRVVQVRGEMAAQFKPPAPWPAFAEVLARAQPVGTVVGTGDALEVTIWEAPPAALFGGATVTTVIQQD